MKKLYKEKVTNLEEQSGNKLGSFDEIVNYVYLLAKKHNAF